MGKRLLQMLIVSVIILFFLFPATADEYTSTTVMVYMIGSDLESAGGFGCDDIDEMRDHCGEQGLNVILCTGGSKKWHTDEIRNDVISYLRVTDDGLVLLKEQELVSMGGSGTLCDFLTYTYASCSSDRYVLILWDHGNGPVMGYGCDRLFNRDALTLREIGEALEGSPFGEDNRLGFIGFDACLMSSLETGVICAPYAHYMVASQEIEPCFGWDYSFLEGCGRLTDEEFACRAASAYMDHAAEYAAQNEYFNDDVTISVIDLEKIPELASAMDALFKEAKDRVSGDYNKLAAQRIRARALGRASTGAEYDLVDLGSLMTEMSVTFSPRCERAARALDDAVVLDLTNVDGLCGLNLFYPYYNKVRYGTDWADAYRDIGILNEYTGYLQRYSGVWMGTGLKELFQEKLIPVQGDDGGYSLNLTREQADAYGSGGFFIMRRMGPDLYVPVSYSQRVTLDGTVLTADYTGRVLWATNDLGASCIPLSIHRDTEQDEETYLVMMELYRESGNKSDTEKISVDVTVSIDTVTNSVRVRSITPWQEDETEEGKKQQIDPEEWRSYRIFDLKSAYLTRDDNGNIKDFFEWPESSWVTWIEGYVRDGLRFTYEPLYDDGKEYYIMFRVRDTQGNLYGSELMPIDLPAAPVNEPGEVMTVCQSGEKTRLIECEGIGVYLIHSVDIRTGGAVYSIEVMNRTDFDAKVGCEGLFIDEKVEMTGGALYEYTQKGHVTSAVIKGVAEACLFSGIDRPESLSFRLTIEDTENGRTLIGKKPFMVTLTDEKARPVYLPWYGLTGEHKELYNDGEIGITLEGLGWYMGGHTTDPESAFADCTAVIGIRNTGTEEVRIAVWGFAADGITTENEKDLKEIFGERGRLLPPGMRMLDAYTIGHKLIDAYDIEQISGLSLILYVIRDGEEQLLAVPVMSAEGIPGRNGYEVLFDDEVCTLYLVKREIKDNSYYGPAVTVTYRLLLENKTDRSLYAAAAEGSVDGITLKRINDYDGSCFAPAGMKMTICPSFDTDLPFTEESEVNILISVYGEDPAYDGDALPVDRFTISLASDKDGEQE